MATARADADERPKGALQQLAELIWNSRPVQEIGGQIGRELSAAPAQIGHELITRGWFGREMRDEGAGIHGPELNETGIHGRGEAPAEMAVGIHGYDDQESRDVYGLTRDERNTIADTRSILDGFGNERGVAQLDRAFLQDIGILEPDGVDWSDFDRAVDGPEPEREPSREQELER